MLAPDLLSALKPAQVLLVSRSGPISQIIREVTASRWSHVAMVANSSGAWVVIEATTDVRGVAARKLEVITDDPTVEALSLRDAAISKSPEWRDQVVRAMWLQTGQPYSNKVNIEILLGIHVAASDGVNCAAAVNEAYWHALTLSPIDATKPTPEAMSRSSLLREVWSWARPSEPTATISDPTERGAP